MNCGTDVTQRVLGLSLVAVCATAHASERLQPAAVEAGTPGARFVAVQGIPASDGSDRRTVSVSLDGRFVAFESAASLTPQDTNTLTDVYVLDRVTRKVTLESIGPMAGAADGSSGAPVLSANGQYVVFESNARNLEAGSDGNQWSDVFLRDRQMQTTRRISVGAAGEPANGFSREPTISPDAGSIAFVSTATNLLPQADANGAGTDVYLFRLRTGVLSRVSVANGGAQSATGENVGPSLSEDGRFVAFVSTADLDDSRSNVARRKGTPDAHTFVRDTILQTTTRIDAALSEAHPDGWSYHPALSANARYVAFVFAAARPGAPTRRGPQVYVYDRAQSTLLLVSRTIRGSPADAASSRPTVSADGRFVAFQSLASNLGCASHCPGATTDLNLLPDVYLFETRSHRIARLSRGPEEWWVPSLGPAMDGSGRLVAFSSRQPRDPSDVDSAFDLYVWAADARE